MQKTIYNGAKCGALQMRLPGWAESTAVTVVYMWDPTYWGALPPSQHLRDTAAPQPVRWGIKIPFRSQAIFPFFSVWGGHRCSSDYAHQYPEWPATDSGPPERLSLTMGQRQTPQPSAPVTEAEHWVIDKHDVLFTAHIQVSMPQTGLGRLLAMWMSGDN